MKKIRTFLIIMLLLVYIFRLMLKDRQAKRSTRTESGRIQKTQGTGNTRISPYCYWVGRMTITCSSGLVRD
ncbi:hypothetical protein ACFLU5_16085 [Bacteroidota bacterium]